MLYATGSGIQKDEGPGFSRAALSMRSERALQAAEKLMFCIRARLLAVRYVQRVVLLPESAEVRLPKLAGFRVGWLSI
jgi:hypothetical protein